MAQPQVQAVSSNPLDDIFGGGPSYPAQAPVQQNPLDLGGLSLSQPIEPQSALFTPFEDANIKVDFECSKDPSNNSLHLLKAIYSNKSAGMISNLNMLVSVKKYLKLELFAVSTPTINPGQANGATQEMKIANTAEGSQGLILKIKVTYQVNGQPMEQTKVISDFPSY